MDGIVSKQKIYRAVYAVMMPLYPLLKRLFPKVVTTTREIGLAMLKAAKQGAPKKRLDSADIHEISGLN
jgi:hypothetical protein